MGRRRNPIRRATKSKTQSGGEKGDFQPRSQPLLPAEAEPDEIDRSAHSEQESNEHEPVVVWIEPAIETVADTTPDE